MKKFQPPKKQHHSVYNYFKKISDDSKAESSDSPPPPASSKTKKVFNWRENLKQMREKENSWKNASNNNDDDDYDDNDSSKKEVNFCEGKRHPIMGYDVLFPESKKPFPAQLAVMCKILTALKKSQHALLESPTGSGKTLALLCSALSWQRAEAERLALEFEETRKGDEEEKKLPEELEKVVDMLAAKSEEDDDGDFVSQENKARKLEEDGDFVSQEQQQQHRIKKSAEALRMVAKGMIKENEQQQKGTKRKLPVTISIDDDDSEDNERAFKELKVASTEKEKAEYVRNKLPKIYFSSRTHSQLAQIIAEFRNCPKAFVDFAKSYGLEMTILGSRKMMCVRPDVRNSSNPTETCMDLLDRKLCSYKQDANRIRGNVPVVWDVEDIVESGNAHGGCPYFYSRDLMERANIVFCPYNYLMDSSIRRAMDLDVTDSIVILDEAHNVETVCRDSATLELVDHNMEEAIKSYAPFVLVAPCYQKMQGLIRGVLSFTKWAQGQVQKTGYEEESAKWSGREILGHIGHYLKVTPSNYVDYETAYTGLRDAENKKAKEGGGKSGDELPQSAVDMAGSIINVIVFMMRNDMESLNDYRLLVVRSRSRSSGRNRNSGAAAWSTKFCLWCMNPAVAFSDIANAARSIVLTSGTLSPMDSFSGELGVDFPVRLEANHVIDTSKQLWIGAVSRGPGGASGTRASVDLCANYKNQQNLPYQDSLGFAILSYVNAVPGGVLVFFPSYSLLEKMQDRWENTSVWNSLEMKKDIYLEPRVGGTALDEMMVDFRRSIRKGRKGVNGKDGALMFAVFRGKVSEGIDFADDQARAVLLVGIPYPSYKDLKVQLKKEYQNQQPKSRNLLSGNTWYGHSAFRALNQALGRCIRHRNDYGAIILLDPRFTRSENQRQLSKWARSSVNSFDYSDQSIHSLKDFFSRLENSNMNPVYKQRIENSEAAKDTAVIELEYSSD